MADTVIGMKNWDINKIESQEFYRLENGVKIPTTPEELFEAYDSLYEIININFKPSRKINRNVKVEKTEALTERIKNSFKDDLFVKIKYGGKEKDLEVRLRTNFEPSLLKIPNIFELNYKNVPVLILREGRVYDKKEIPTAFKSLGEGALRENYLKKLDASKLNLIPEPVLVKSLENLYAQGAPRITPEVKTIDENEHKTHYLRKFIGPALRDISLIEEMTGKYIGLVHSFGLIERADRNTMQYFLPNTGNIVNIDPDFFAWSQRDAYQSTDFEDFMSTIKEMYPTIETKHIRKIKEIRKDTIMKNKDLKHELEKELIKNTQWYEEH